MIIAIDKHNLDNYNRINGIVKKHIGYDVLGACVV